MTNYKTADGKVLTEEMIESWCNAYEKGEFPKGEHSAGNVVYGRPPLSSEGTEVLSIKLPVGMKRAIEQKAKEDGVSTSAYARAILTDALVS